MDKRNHSHLPTRTLPFTVLSAALVLAGCSSLDGVVGSSRVDYRSEAVKTPELEVPPDLTQLARDQRYRPQATGAVTASGVGAGSTAAAGPAAAAATPAVALNSLGGMRIERQGNQRWLVVPQAPEQLWPQLQAFWQERGFSLAVDSPTAGVMETTWAENRGKIPQDIIRRTLGRLIDGMYDTGTRDSFRTRLERTEAGTEITISHRGVVEEVLGAQRDRTQWRVTPPDSQLEAEFLTRLMIKLGGVSEPAARQAVAAAPERGAPRPPGGTPPAAPRSEATSLELNESFERAYRRVGIALDRSGFTVEDRDRTAGLYFVRYVASAAEEPGFLTKLFSSKDAQTPVRYRVLVKASGEGKSLVTVQTSAGQPETGDVAKRIIGFIANDLR